jgi:hypothetical protein
VSALDRLPEPCMCGGCPRCGYIEPTDEPAPTTAEPTTAELSRTARMIRELFAARRAA